MTVIKDGLGNVLATHPGPIDPITARVVEPLFDADLATSNPYVYDQRCQVGWDGAQFIEVKPKTFDLTITAEMWR